jgi:uncharacterized membrane protein YbhN (UPF0104 family)
MAATNQPTQKKKLVWWQLVLPVLVLVLLFGVVLPQFIDYEEVWKAITSLDGRSLVLLVGMGVLSSWLEAGIYTTLIPGLGMLAGWKAFLGGNTVAGFAPSPWDIVVRYALYRGFGVEGSVAGASVIVGGGFQVAFAIVAPLLVLVGLVATGHGDRSARVLTALAVVAVLGAVVVIGMILRREELARRIGRWLQSAADWVMPKFKRAPPPNLETSTVEFRGLLTNTLASRWWMSASFLFGSHTIKYLGMLYLFRELDIGPEVVSALELLGVYVIGVFMSLMPVVPAGLGLVELTYIWLIAGDDAALADLVAAATFAHRIFFWLLPILIGLIPLFGWIRKGGTMSGIPDHENPTSLINPASDTD